MLERVWLLLLGGDISSNFSAASVTDEYSFGLFLGLSVSAAFACSLSQLSTESVDSRW